MHLLTVLYFVNRETYFSKGRTVALRALRERFGYFWNSNPYKVGWDNKIFVCTFIRAVGHAFVKSDPDNESKWNLRDMLYSRYGCVLIDWNNNVFSSSYALSAFACICSAAGTLLRQKRYDVFFSAHLLTSPIGYWRRLFRNVAVEVLPDSDHCIHHCWDSYPPSNTTTAAEVKRMLDIIKTNRVASNRRARQVGESFSGTGKVFHDNCQ